jgi:hypothetical protein
MNTQYIGSFGGFAVTFAGVVSAAAAVMAVLIKFNQSSRARSAVVEATARPRATLHEGADKTDEGDSVGFCR